MLSAGVSAVESLRIIGEQTRNSRVRRAIALMVKDVQGGRSLSYAMGKWPQLFSLFLVETVHVGEVTGRLTDTLERIAVDLEYTHEVNRDIRAQLTYPVIVIAVMVVVLSLLMFYVLPRIATLFTEMNVPLPLPTRILLGMGSLLRTHPLEIVAIMVAMTVMIAAMLKNRQGRYVFHAFLLRLPLIGTLIQEAHLTLFFRALEALFASGISVLRSVDIASKTMHNEAYRRAVASVPPLLMRGVSLSDALRPFPKLFPLQAQRMIEVGEKSGKLEEGFRHVSSYYERSLKYRTKTLTSMLEPALMIVVGVVVGGIAVSIFLPIYQTAYQVF